MTELLITYLASIALVLSVTFYITKTPDGENKEKDTTGYMPKPKER